MKGRVTNEGITALLRSDLNSKTWKRLREVMRKRAEEDQRKAIERFWQLDHPVGRGVI